MVGDFLQIGSVLVDDETHGKGMIDFFFWSHALISDEIYQGTLLNCNFSSLSPPSDSCETCVYQAQSLVSGKVYIYNIYAPFCGSPDASWGKGFDPCTDNYIFNYLNLPEVQIALHANVTNLPGPWNS